MLPSQGVAVHPERSSEPFRLAHPGALVSLALLAVALLTLARAARLSRGEPPTALMPVSAPGMGVELPLRFGLRSDAVASLGLLVLAALLAVAWRATRRPRQPTVHHQATPSLVERIDVFRVAFDHAPIPTAVVGSDGRWLQVNYALCELLGYGEHELQARAFQEVGSIDDRAVDLAYLRYKLETGLSSFRLEARYVHKRGHVLWLPVSIAPVRDEQGQLLSFIFPLQDITERKQMEELLTRQASYDPLTGLANRTLFHDRLQRAVLLGRRTRAPFALLLIDLDDFKPINDRHGHRAGDLVLQQVAARLRGVLRQSDTIARLGGDEFAVLLPTPTTAEAAQQTAERIIEALSAAFVVESRRLLVRGSIGIALYPAHGTDAETLVSHADIAMYHAKSARCGQTLYSPQMGEAERSTRAFRVGERCVA